MTDPAPEPRPDPRPRPRWGEYADVPPAPPAPQYPPPSIPEPEPQPTAPKRRTGDMVVTTALLLIGVYDVVAQWPFYTSLGAGLRQAYELQGLGEFTSIGLADSIGSTLNIVRGALLVIAIVWALVRIGRGQRAFWVPLAAGVLAAIIVTVALFAIIFQDPALAEYVQQQSGTSGG